jgi:AraC-like DNA-binding protein
MLDFPAVPVAPDADYAVVRKAIEFISTRWRDQPSIEAIADHVGLSASHFQHVFKRWAGLTPKAFLQALTLDHARELLRDSASVLDAAYDVGLSGPSRLHDLFVSHEALTPGDYRRDDLELAYGFHPSPFGEAIVVAAPRGLAGLGFVDDEDRAAALADMRRRWPRARFVEDAGRDGAARRPRLRFGAVAARRAAADRHDRHRFRGAGVGDAARRADGPRDDLFRHRPPSRQAQRGARGRRRGRAQPDLVRRPLSSRSRALRRADRLPLGPGAQAGDHRLGSRPDSGQPRRASS